MSEKKLVNQYKFLMWGGGLIMVAFGLVLFILYGVFIGLMITIAYPYINADLLLIIRILGWFYLIPGIILFILGFFAKKIALHGLEPSEVTTQKPLKRVKYLRIFVIIASIFLLLAFPIGTFIGFALLRESWILKTNPSSD
jgi:hypothetical protein